jgi:hypothetical protein
MVVTTGKAVFVVRFISALCRASEIKRTTKILYRASFFLAQSFPLIASGGAKIEVRGV